MEAVISYKPRTLKENILAFLLGGNSYFTVLNNQTGNRFTYKIRKRKGDNPESPPTYYWVSVLRGISNISDYSFLGSICYTHERIYYTHSYKSQMSSDAPSVKVITWLINAIQNKKVPDFVDILHEGRCCCCGRVLTVPESIRSGIGPECAKRAFKF